MSRNLYFLFCSIVLFFEKRIQTISLAAYLFDEEETSEDNDQKTEKRSGWVQSCLQQRKKML